MNENEFKEVFDKHGCEIVEMEAFALFANAKLTNKHAACLLTVSDSFITNEHATAVERQKSFTNMMKVALEIS
jgi:purine-nucleoside phosphorylase